MSRNKPEIIMSWSGGKDSTMALYYLLQQNQYNVVGLLTTLNAENERVSVHGIRTPLLEWQANSIGIPIYKVFLTPECSSNEYCKKMENQSQLLKKSGVSGIAFGDIFLRECRDYRERNLAKVGLEPIFPIWGRNTRELVNEFIDLGFKAVISYVNIKQLDQSFTGQSLDYNFVDCLPDHVDPCGEIGIGC